MDSVKTRYRYDLDYEDDPDNEEVARRFDSLSRAQQIGGVIYMEALKGRRGFRDDQIGIDEPEIWAEIFEHIGSVALALLNPKDNTNG